MSFGGQMYLLLERNMRRYAGLLLVCAIFIGQTGAAQSQSLVIAEGGIPWRLGDGTNQVTNDRFGTCIKSTAESADPRPIGQKIEVEQISSFEQISKLLDLGAYAGSFGIGTKLAARFREIDTNSTTAESNHLALRVRVSGLIRRFTNIEPSETAIALLKKRPDGKLFAEACGDAVVDQTEDGAEFLAFITHKKITKTAQNELQTTMSAAGAIGELGADARKKLQDYSKTLEIKVDITQIGLASEPPPSLTDLASLMEYARTFGSRVAKSQEARPVRAHYTKFANLPAFVFAKSDAQAALLSFDDSIDVMGDIVRSYELARERHNAIASILSSPSEFEGPDANNDDVLRQYQKMISNRVQALANEAHACAKKTKDGSQCVRPIDLSVADFPKVSRIAACALSSEELTAKDGCKSRQRINGKCRCVACAFISVRFNSGQNRFSETCRGMPPGATAVIKYAGQVGLNSAPSQGWYGIQLGEPVIFKNTKGDNPPVLDFIAEEKKVISVDGEVAYSVYLEQCQGHRLSDCWLAPRPNKSHIVEISISP